MGLWKPAESFETAEGESLGVDADGGFSDQTGGWDGIVDTDGEF
jgi:hypothetical protein